MSGDKRDSGFDADVDSNKHKHARKQSGASSITTVTAPGDVGSPELPSPGPGKLSVLFRRASAASQLPPDMAPDSDRDDGQRSGTEDRDNGDGGEGGSMGSGSVGTCSGLTGGDGGRRTPGRRDPVAKQQRPQAQPRGRDGDRGGEYTRWGGRSDIGNGSVSSAGTACSGSSRGVTAGKVGGQRTKADKPGGKSGEGLGEKEQGAVTKKKDLYPTSGEFRDFAV